MSTICVSFKVLASATRVSALKQRLSKFFSLFIPIANPDFETKIGLVSTWLIEFDADTSLPSREIGLDEHQQVILKMPFKKNYGYWIDNNLVLDDFKRLFQVSLIDSAYFEQEWRKLE